MVKVCSLCSSVPYAGYESSSLLNSNTLVFFSKKQNRGLRRELRIVY